MDYVRPEVIGQISEELSLDRLGYVSQMLCQSKVGRLLFRCTHQNAGLTLPPDLQVLGLTVTKPSLDSEFCILDFDHSIEEQSKFEPASASATLISLHDILDRTFRAAVRPEALKEWE